MDDPVLIDARGFLCPLPVLRLRKVLANQPVGRRVRLLATDQMTVVDVPHFCDQAGHAIIAVKETGDGVHEFVVERGLSAPSTAGGLTPEDI